MTARANDRARAKSGDARRGRGAGSAKQATGSAKQGAGRKRTQKGARSPQPDASASSKRRGRPQNARKNRRRTRPNDVTDTFWGERATLPAAETDVRINDDPAAVPRSLGPPPLPGHEAIAEHYFAAVYERAVATAGALAAAGGLIDPDALTDNGDR